MSDLMQIEELQKENRKLKLIISELDKICAKAITTVNSIDDGRRSDYERAYRDLSQTLLNKIDELQPVKTTD